MCLGKAVGNHLVAQLPSSVPVQHRGLLCARNTHCSTSLITSLLCQLLVWNHSSLSPVQQYTEHLAAVKAIAWSPHQHGLLASGGGTADRCIRFWNTLTGQPLQCIDTGSQVCNLAWSKHANELVSSFLCSPTAELPPVQKLHACFPLPFQVSTHGYSQNQILVWKYPSLTQVAKLTGHSYRVLYLVSDGHVSENLCNFCSCFIWLQIKHLVGAPLLC